MYLNFSLYLLNTSGCSLKSFIGNVIRSSKSTALYKYIYEERNRGRNLFGGLVILDGEKFKYFESAP